MKSLAREALDQLRKDRYINENKVTLSNLIQKALEEAISEERPTALWEYHNDEHGVWWGCGNCGKIVHKPPHDKRYCSRCGAQMEREA